MSTAVQFKKVVLIGASGNLGAIILPRLLKSKAFEVTVLTRTSSAASFPADVSVVKTSYSEDDLAEVFRGQDAIISAVGANSFQEQKVFIDAAIKAGVQRFLPVFEPKKAILDYLREKENTGLTWTGLSTGPLEQGLSNGFLGYDIANKKAVIWDDGKISFSATNQADVGNAVVSVLMHPIETANQYLYVASLTTCQKAILDSLEVQTGEKWTVEHVKTEEQIALGRKLVSEGDFTGMFALVRATAWGTIPGIRSNYVVEEKLANAILELPEGDLDETVRNVLRSH